MSPTCACRCVCFTLYITNFGRLSPSDLQRKTEHFLSSCPLRFCKFLFNVLIHVVLLVSLGGEKLCFRAVCFAALCVPNAGLAGFLLEPNVLVQSSPPSDVNKLLRHPDPAQGHSHTHQSHLVTMETPVTPGHQGDTSQDGELTIRGALGRVLGSAHQWA